MKEPAFDIFSGGPNDDPLWLETVTSLSDARERMEIIAAKTPGRYFIFSFGSQSIVCQTETFKKVEAAKAKSA